MRALTTLPRPILYTMKFAAAQSIAQSIGLDFVRSLFVGDRGYHIVAGTKPLLNGPSWCPTLASAKAKLAAIKETPEGFWIQYVK
jgi:hypothetical protein